MNEKNKMYNNDERMNSSLSSSLKERKMEDDGNQLQAARERHESMPSNLSSNGNIASPRRLPSKNSLNDGNRGISNKNALPEKGGINSPTSSSNRGLVDSRGQSLKNKVASKGLQAMGVPKGISEGLTNSKLAKALSVARNPAAAALKGIGNGLKNAGKSEAEKDEAEKEEEEQQKEKRTGPITLRVPLKVKLIIFLAILPSFSFVLLFLSVITAAVGDEKVYNTFLGNTSSKEEKASLKAFRKDLINSAKGNADFGLGMGASSYDTYNEFLSRNENLGNIFEHFECQTDEECLERDEVKFYIKVNDISNRYKNKYHVTLDWELLMVTALSLDLDVKDMFVEFFHNYNEDDVEKYDVLMDLDWDYDYKKIPGYSYLDADDYRYDLQILAKNMVTKTTTQTCSKVVDGAVVITKTQTDTDIEDQYLKPGEDYYLQCAAGESYSISSNYRLDLQKYDEFLLEYIEHKLYLESIGVDPITGETDMTPSSASGEYIWPLPPGAATRRSSAFGWREDPFTHEVKYHGGDDYPAPAGTPVYAVADGKVVVSAKGWNGGYGNYIKIDHGNGLASIYAHASELFVSTGDQVKQGDVIMAVGTTGRSTGNHLHITFELNGEKVAPSNYIGVLGS